MSEQTEHRLAAREMVQQVEAELAALISGRLSQDKMEDIIMNLLRLMRASERGINIQSAYIDKLEFERDTYKAALGELEEVAGHISLDQVRQVSPATATALELMRASKKSKRRKSNAGR